MSDTSKIGTEERVIDIGKFTLCECDYADKFWIYKFDGEGVGLDDNGLKELEQLIEEFFNRKF